LKGQARNAKGNIDLITKIEDFVLTKDQKAFLMFQIDNLIDLKDAEPSVREKLLGKMKKTVESFSTGKKAKDTDNGKTAEAGNGTTTE
jgi:hypothetical protein